LSRVHQPNHPHYPYLQYHSTDDTPAIVSAERLDASAALVWKNSEGIESSPLPPPPSPTPTPHYKGEVFLSRYGIHIDPTEDPEGRRHLFKVMNLIDGTRSIEQIAATSAAPVDAVQRIVGLLQQHGLVAL
jgi:aminopeptidase-like protein